MITSEKQYKAAEDQLEMLKGSLRAPKKKNVPPAIAKASNLQLKALISEIKCNLKEYEFLKNSTPSEIEIHSLDDLMLAPIRYRIAANMSVDAFGRKVAISARQIARYESENYQNINASTFKKILSTLNLHLEGKVA